MPAALKNDQIAAKLTQVRLDNFAENCMLEYGTEVIEDRALPDYRDGVLPVYRKTLWSMHEQHLRSSGGTKKSARIVGDVIGKYHPHGDQPAYGALVTMVNMPMPLAIGQGNFGFFGDPAADYRYTEAKLSPYSERIMMAPEYMRAVPMVPNFDGEETEPLFMPGILPNILLNGTFGIAVGVSTGIPPFARDSVITIIKRGLEGKPIDTAACAKYLRIEYPKPYQSKILTDAKELREFYDTGKGRLVLGVEYTVQGRDMLITKFPPYFSMDRAKEKILTRIEEVHRVDDITDGDQCVLRVSLKSSVNIIDRNTVFERCAQLLEFGFNLRINYIRRKVKDGEIKVKFFSTSMPKLINMWIKWRTSLERRAQKIALRLLQEALDRQLLMLLACDNREKIFAELRRRAANLEQRLADALTISLEQATIISRMQVRALSALSQDDIKKEIGRLRAEIKVTQGYIKNPAYKILQDLPALTKSIS